jgi:c-di-GMP-binding flagellar brake protein YcgR
VAGQGFAEVSASFCRLPETTLTLCVSVSREIRLEEARGNLAHPAHGDFVDQRQHQRFPFKAEIRIYPRNSLVVRGQTVDISESGISAMLAVEVPIGEVVRIEFNLASGPVELYATVRQRNAFRYGLQFLDAGSAQEAITRTCRQLALDHELFGPKLP